MSRAPLTRTQQAVYDAITASVQRRGYPPSVREIMAATGLDSTSSVAHQLHALQDKGYIRRTPGQPRSLVVLDPGPSGTAGPSATAGPQLLGRDELIQLGRRAVNQAATTGARLTATTAATLVVDAIADAIGLGGGTAAASPGKDGQHP